MLSIGVPLYHAVCMGLVSNARGYTASSRYDKYILVPVIARRIGHFRTIRREPRITFLVRRVSKLYGGATLLGHQPHITAVDENNLIIRHIHVTHKLGVDLSVRKISDK